MLLMTLMRKISEPLEWISRWQLKLTMIAFKLQVPALHGLNHSTTTHHITTGLIGTNIALINFKKLEVKLLIAT